MSWNFNINVKVTDEFLQDVLTCAAEGGIGYWCEDYDVKRRKDLSVYEIIEMKDDDGYYFEQGAMVDLKLLVNGIRSILDGTVSVNESILDDIRKGVMDGDAGDIDAERADCCVQAALFGEIVFG